MSIVNHAVANTLAMISSAQERSPVFVDLRMAGLAIERRALKRLATVVVHRTYSHERLPFTCGVSHHLLGALMTCEPLAAEKPEDQI